MAGADCNASTTAVDGSSPGTSRVAMFDQPIEHRISGAHMSTLTANHPPVVQDALDAPVRHDDLEPPTPIQPGSRLRASNGRLWTIRALHPGQRVELVTDTPAGPVGMIIDRTAAARMVPTDDLDRASGPTDT
jgi:hypothetical protein